MMDEIWYIQMGQVYEVCMSRRHDKLKHAVPLLCKKHFAIKHHKSLDKIHKTPFGILSRFRVSCFVKMLPGVSIIKI